MIRVVIAALLGALLMAGCATAPRIPTDGTRNMTGVDTPSATGAAAPAVVALLEESDRRLAAGETAAAASSLERALRIEPDNALLWHRLATVLLRQEGYEQAEAMAVKSNGLARGDRELMSRNWLLIAEARQRRGDAEGAVQALELVPR